MSGWIELASGRKWQTSIAGADTAQKVFVEDASGTDSIPAYNDGFEGSDTILAQTFATEYYHGDPSHRIVTVSYSEAGSVPQNSPTLSFTAATAFADLPRSITAGLSNEKLDEGTNAYWTGTTDPVNQPRYIGVPTMTLTIPKIYSSWAALIGTTEPLLGRVTSGSWEGTDGAHWKFVGYNANEYRDSGGTLRIRADMMFEYRTVPLASGTEFGGWNHLYNEAAGAWQIGTPLIYATVDFAPLFA